MFDKDSSNSSSEGDEEETSEVVDQEDLSPEKCTFESLGVTNWIRRQLSCLGITTPSPVQAQCIPPVLEGKDLLSYFWFPHDHFYLTGRDCVGVAKTGQGKTLAFAIPILQELSVDPYGIFAVVLTPTRELAAQIGDSFASVGAGMGLRHVVVTGGRDTIRQSQDLDRRPHVVVATPGRLADHIRNNSTLSLARVKYLVLDEADRLLAGANQLSHSLYQATYAMVLVPVTSYQRQVCQSIFSQILK